VPAVPVLRITGSRKHAHVGKARAVEADGPLIMPFTAETLRRPVARDAEGPTTTRSIRPTDQG